MKRFIMVCFLTASLFASLQEDVKLLKEAQTLLKSDTSKAIPILKKLYSSYKDTQIAQMLAFAYEKEKEFSSAAFYFEQCDQASLRLKAAKLYYSLENYTKAKTLFISLMPQLSLKEKNEARRYLAQIKKKAGKKLLLSATIGYEENIYNVPRDNIYIDSEKIAFNNDSDIYASQTLSFDLLIKRYSLKFLAENRNYREHADINYQFASLYLGKESSLLEKSKLGIRFDHLVFGSESYFSTLLFLFDVTRDRFVFNNRIGYQKNHPNIDKDKLFFELKASYVTKKKPFDYTIGIGFKGDAGKADSDYISKNSYKAFIDIKRLFGEYYAAASYKFEGKVYDHKDSYYGYVRKDISHAFSLSARYASSKKLVWLGELSYIDNYSNEGLFDYKKSVASLSARYKF